MRSLCLSLPLFLSSLSCRPQTTRCFLCAQTWGDVCLGDIHIICIHARCRRAGDTAGGGACDIVACCDLVIGTPESTFAITPAKVGLPYHASGDANWAFIAAVMD